MKQQLVMMLVMHAWMEKYAIAYGTLCVLWFLAYHVVPFNGAASALVTF